MKTLEIPFEINWPLAMSFSKIFILIALGSKGKNHEYFILRAVTLGIYETKSSVCFAKRSGFKISSLFPVVENIEHTIRSEIQKSM